MSKEEAINNYIEKFGGFPYMLFMGATDEVIIKAVEKALKDGKEIKNQREDVDY